MHTGIIQLTNHSNTHYASFGMLNATLPKLQDKLSTLHPNEVQFYQSITHPIRKHSYVLGRTVAKAAVTTLTGQPPQSFFIDRGVFQFPIVKSIYAHNTQVSISHCNTIGIAMAYPEEHPIGVDVEKIKISKALHIQSLISHFERRVIAQSDLADLSGYTLLWTAKEGLSKILKTGLSVDLKLLEINTFAKFGDAYVSTFKHFPQYKAISFLVKGHACSMVLPEQSIPQLANFQRAFQHILSFQN